MWKLNKWPQGRKRCLQTNISVWCITFLHVTERCDLLDASSFLFFFFGGGGEGKRGGGREELLALLWLMIYGHCQQLFYTKRLVEFCHNICIACSCDGFLKIPREAGANVIFNCGVTFFIFYFPTWNGPFHWNCYVAVLWCFSHWTE